MGYYIEIRPRDRSPVSVNEMKERLLAIGLEPHPALTHPDAPPEEKEMYQDDLVYSGGLLSVETTDRSPAQVRVVARASWGDDQQSIRSCIIECLAIAWGTNSDLLGPDDEDIDFSNLHVLVDQFMSGRKVFGQMFGFCRPTPESGDEISIEGDSVC